MQVKPADLDAHLKRGLARAYLIAGDDTLLVQEACDSVLRAARQAGFSERSTHYAEKGFNWNDLIQDASSMSLFAERRIMDVRVTGGGFDREASEVLRRYADHPADDTLLVIRAPRLEGKQRSSAWFKALDKLGVVVPVWPIDARDLPRWLAGRLEQAGVALSDQALAVLAERVEGNLLAAVQEIEKLKLAGLPSPIAADDLLEVLQDAAHYDVFELIDVTLAGEAARASRMVTSLRQEGVALFAILGALTSQLRRIIDGGYVPAPRQRAVKAFLGRIGGVDAIDAVLAECALVDAQGKGQIPGDPWDSLEDLLLRLCRVRPVPGVNPLRLLR